jgi:hypothetical protein
MRDRRFFVVFHNALASIWGMVAVLLLLTSVVISVTALAWSLRLSQNQVDELQAESTCRARSAILLSDAEGRRDDVLAELLETIGLLFDSTLSEEKRLALRAKLPLLSVRISETSEVIYAAREDRLNSVDNCDKDRTEDK